MPASKHEHATPRRIALSIKQPWATLVVFGIKSIEIRKWSTTRRGLIYIHTGRDPDPRDEGWSLVPDHLREFTEYRRGIIGRAHLLDCHCYDTQEQFALDQERHRNQPNWFEPPKMHGLVFSGSESVPFESCAGNLRFFSIPDQVME